MTRFDALQYYCLVNFLILTTIKVPSLTFVIGMQILFKLNTLLLDGMNNFQHYFTP